MCWDRIVYTVEPANKGHFGDNINSAVYREVVLSSEVLKCREGQVFGLEQCPRGLTYIVPSCRVRY